jgi:hypothetical protein
MINAYCAGSIQKAIQPKPLGVAIHFPLAHRVFGISIIPSAGFFGIFIHGLQHFKKTGFYRV